MNKALKIGIIGGLITWLITTVFLQPISNLVWKSVVGITRAINQGYVDAIYSNAALSDRDLIGHVTFLLVFIAFLIGLGVLLNTREIARRSRPARQPSDKAFNGVMIFLAVMCLGITLVLFSLSNGSREITASFDQRLTIIAPLISELEYKTFKARWAGMKTEADYKSLIAAMEERAKELGVVLPRLPQSAR
jgi:nitrate reductase gamma subunit